MLLPEDIFRIVLLGLLLGFTAMASLTSLEVWRRRSLVVQGRDARPLTGIERFAILLAGGGALAMLAALSFRVAMPREGALVTEGVHTVRVLPGYEVLDVTQDDEVAEGDVVARFRAHPPDGESRLVEIRTPVTGSVMYRAGSPSTAYGADALVVISPPDGFRVRMRLPTREVEDLRAAGTVELKLLGKQFVARRFTGHLVSARPIDGQPRWSDVEVAGRPLPDAVRDTVAPPPVLEGDEVGIRVAMKWSPPFLHMPLFQTGLALEGLALLLTAGVAASRFAASLRTRRPQEEP